MIIAEKFKPSTVKFLFDQKHIVEVSFRLSKLIEKNNISVEEFCRRYIMPYGERLLVEIVRMQNCLNIDHDLERISMRDRKEQKNGAEGIFLELINKVSSNTRT